jgi:hypothetical protein
MGAVVTLIPRQACHTRGGGGGCLFHETFCLLKIRPSCGPGQTRIGKRVWQQVKEKREGVNRACRPVAIRERGRQIIFPCQNGFRVERLLRERARDFILVGPFFTACDRVAKCPTIELKFELFNCFLSHSFSPTHSCTRS